MVAVRSWRRVRVHARVAPPRMVMIPKPRAEPFFRQGGMQNEPGLPVVSKVSESLERQVEEPTGRPHFHHACIPLHPPYNTPPVDEPHPLIPTVLPRYSLPYPQETQLLSHYFLSLTPPLTPTIPLWLRYPHHEKAAIALVGLALHRIKLRNILTSSTPALRHHNASLRRRQGSVPRKSS